MVGATLLFALMAVCVKLASASYSATEIVMYRGLVGVVLITVLARGRGIPLRTRVPSMHLWRGLLGVTSLCLWFWAISGLPLATAMTLNAMSSIWMAVYLMGGAVLLGAKTVDGRLVTAVLVGFAGVVCVLRPTLAQEQLLWGLAGLGSGLVASMAYLTVNALGRAGEPEVRVVFYFSLASVVAGALLSWATATPWRLEGHSAKGLALLFGVGATATSAQLMLTAAYARGKVLTNACLNYLGIAFSALLGWLVFNEQPGWLAALGIGLIVLAGLAATFVRAKVIQNPIEPDCHE
jgi:drug/metabolite transporter (DMT)-like permease